MGDARFAFVSACFTKINLECNLEIEYLYFKIYIITNANILLYYKRIDTLKTYRLGTEGEYHSVC